MSCRKGDGRQYQVVQGARKGLPTPLDRRIEYEHSGDARARIDAVTDLANDGEPTELCSENQLQKQAKPKYRDTYPEHHQQPGQGLGGPVSLASGEPPEGDGDADVDEHRRQHQFDRRGNNIRQIGQDGSLGKDGCPEVAVGQTRYIVDVLYQNGLIEPEPNPSLLDLRGSRQSPRCDVRGVARNDLRH